MQTTMARMSSCLMSVFLYIDELEIKHNITLHNIVKEGANGILVPGGFSEGDSRNCAFVYLCRSLLPTKFSLPNFKRFVPVNSLKMVTLMWLLKVRNLWKDLIIRDRYICSCIIELVRVRKKSSHVLLGQDKSNFFDKMLLLEREQMKIHHQKGYFQCSCERTGKKKVIVFEEPDESAEAEDDYQGNNDEHDSVDELVDDPENLESSKKDEAGGTSERREVSTAEKIKDVNVEKEKRSKKRNERPPSSEEDKTVRVAKKVKTTASRPTKKAASTLKGRDLRD
ncbi:hypothetical protein P8452_43248 [Trifolium repens]|nr:hypothetical protein P8452_43248 [Trifolium repens]